jgi:hypothetical protein
MNGRSKWLALVAVGLATACAACGDDESAQDGGGGSGGGDATTSTSTSTGTDATTGSTSSTSNSSSSGGGEECPETTPLEGEACTPTVPTTCHYDQEAFCPNGDFTNASIDATCTDGAWAIESESSGECCPETPPQSGLLACSIEGTTCELAGDVVCAEGGSIGGTVVTTCDGETWQTVYEPTGGECEGETACPSSAPETGDACDSAVFQEDCLWERSSPCLDGPGYNVITVAACNPLQQAWAVGTFFDGTECADCESGFCDPDGMACIYTYTDDEACDGDGATVTVGAECVTGESDTVWEIRDCE